APAPDQPPTRTHPALLAGTARRSEIPCARWSRECRSQAAGQIRHARRRHDVRLWRSYGPAADLGAGKLQPQWRRSPQAVDPLAERKLELERLCQITQRRFVMRLQRSVAFGEAGKDRQLEPPGDEAQDRCRVVEGVID